MHDAILNLSMFHAIAALELFALAAFQSCLPAPRRNPRFMWIAEPLPVNAQPDASNRDFAESYDEAA